jgi:hypothetical protein
VGLNQKDIAPSIIDISKKKNFTVLKGLEHDYWISNLNSKDDIPVTRIQEFSILWDKIQEVHLIDDPKSITWKLSNSGVYSSSSAYLAQFETPPTSFMVPAVCANWAPPKCKSFAWLILKNQVQTADCLIHHGWSSCGLFQLCKRELETTTHLIFQCGYSIRVCLVYAHECALLVNFRIHDTKKNPGGRTGYPKKYWNPYFCKS